MSKTVPVLAAVLLLAAELAAAEPPRPIVSGLTNPESVAVGPDGQVFVSVIGEFDKPGDGAVLKVEDGKTTPVATGLDDPKGIAVFRQWLFVTDRDKVVRITLPGTYPAGKGKTKEIKEPTIEPFAEAAAFPAPPKFLNDVVVDPESGTLYVSDSGDLKGTGGAVYKITPKGQVTLLADAQKVSGLHTPNGLVMDGASHVLLGDFGTGVLYRLKVADGSAEKLADGLGAIDGLAWDHHGRLFITDWTGGRVFVIPRPGERPVLLLGGFQAAADLCHDPARKRLLVPDMKAGTIVPVAPVAPGFEVDETPLPFTPTLAFPDLTWTGWEPETESGKSNPLRPIVLTHAGDGTGRLFVATQHGVVHVFPNDQSAKQTKVFLDIRDRVKYDDKTNEEGFLGLAFHPRYKETGEFFVFYTPRAMPKTNLVARFRVSKDDPDRADPTSEEEVLRFENKPFWNHDGGTIVFGPDGMLYATHGDGGSGGDPFDNGQNLNTWFGKILRIDIDRRENGKNYAVPKDNPFVGRADAKPEIWAYGLRNVWRMAFDRPTGQFWAGDVGQNLYEEIDLIRKGGNYGWRRREALHPFGPTGTGARPEFIDPIWEYHHDVGKSITGGAVYRGSRLPEIQGHYLYADYVSNKIWALKYDEAKGRVVANRPLKDHGRPVISFGEDGQGELYLLSVATNGKGIYRLTPTK